MSNGFVIVEDKTQNAVLAAMNIITTRIELAIRLIKTSFGQDVASVTANSGREKQLGGQLLVRAHLREKTHFVNSIQMMRLEVITLKR